MLLVQACSSTPIAPPEDNTGAPTSLVITSNVDTVESIGERIDLSATATDAAGGTVEGTVSWVSGDPRIALITQTGRLTSVNNGTTVLIAQLDLLRDTIEIVIAQKPTSVTIESVSDTARSIGIRQRMRATVRDAQGVGIATERAKPTWSTSDPTVARIDEPGKVLPTGRGTADVIVTAGDAVGTHPLTVFPSISVEIDTALAERMQWALEDSTVSRRLRSVTASVTIGDKVWTGVSGRSNDLAEAKPDMLYGWASVTKTAVGAATMLLVEDGALSLSDNVGTWFSDLPNIPTTVTVRQLLQHTTGIFDYVIHPNLTTSRNADTQRVWTPREIIENFVTTPIFTPGERFSYSNTNFIVLGMIIEEVTSKTVAQVMRERLWVPNQLNAMFLLGQESSSGTIATGWSDISGTGTLQDFAIFFGPATHSLRWTAGGIFATATDMALWGRALYTAKAVTQGSLDEMNTFIDPMAGSTVWTGAGLGTLRYQFGNKTTWGHAGAISGFSSLMIYSPDDDVSIAVAINQDAGSHNFAHFRITEALLNLAR